MPGEKGSEIPRPSTLSNPESRVVEPVLPTDLPHMGNNPLVGGLEERGLSGVLPPHLAERARAAEEAGFSPEHPMTSSPESVINVAEETLAEPKEPVGMFGFGKQKDNEPTDTPIQIGNVISEPEEVITETKTGNPDSSLPTAPPNNGGREPPGGRGGDREPPSPNPENLWSPESAERGRGLVELIVDMRTTMTYDERYGGENRPRIRGLYASVQRFVNGLASSGRLSPEDLGAHKRFPRPTRRLVGDELVETLPVFPSVEEEVRRIHEDAQAFLDRYRIGEEDSPPASADLLPTQPLPDLADVSRSLATSAERFNNPPSRDVLITARGELLNYFNHAKNEGLLKDVDAVLSNLHRQILSGQISQDEYNNGLAVAMSMGLQAFRNRMADPDESRVPPEQLRGVWVVYVDWASERLQRTMNRVDQAPPLEGEWSFNPEEQEGGGRRRETYWRVGPYPKMYIVDAQTPEQYITAKETFLKMIGSGLLGRSPTANFEHVKNFIEEFSRAGGIQAERGEISVGFMEENRQELEALLYLLVANYSKEVYNPQQAKEAAMAMAMDEGPQRWLRAYRAGKGKTAFFTHMFDYEEMMDIFNNSVGEQGELTIVAGHYMQDMIQEMAIERGMGCVLKDYDPREEYFSQGDPEARAESPNNWDLGAKIQAAADLERAGEALKKIETGLATGTLVLPADFRQAKMREGVITVAKGKIVLVKGATAEMLLSEEHYKARLKAYTTNLNRLGLTRNVEEFKALYEGFDKGDYHINNYLDYKEDQRLFLEDQQRPEGEREYIRKYPELGKLPESIKKSIELGEVQVKLRDLRQAVLRGEIQLEPGQSAKSRLSARDRQIYQEAYDEAASSFEVAFQMQNVMGEKARRGKGFVYVDRNEHIQTYFAVSDVERTRWADEKKTKVTNIDGLSTQEIDALIPQLVIEGTLRSTDIESFKKGWMIYKVSRDKKKPEHFVGEWKRLYEGMSDEEREDIVDNIPTYKAENWVQWGVTQIKMKYADAPVEVRRQKVKEGWRRLIKEVKTNGYSAQLWDDESDENGRPRLMRYKRPLGRVDPETGEFKKFKNGEVLGYSASGQKIKLSFDNNGKPERLSFTDSKLVVYDSTHPEQRMLITIEGITPDTIARQVDDESFTNEMDRLAEEVEDQGEFSKLRQALSEQVRETLIEEVIPSFEFAANGGDFRSNYTQDSYNYYQGNDRVTAFLPHVLAGKYAIAVGLSRPEDEDLIARRAMVVDPTRRRTRKFPDGQQEREVALVAGAVLESMQDRMRIRHGVQRAFLPKDAYVARMRMGYRNEDWAGMDRFTFGFAELAAQQPQRFVRRLGAEIAIAPLEHDSGPARWGVSGITEGVKLMADPIASVSKQRLKGQFGLTKVFESHDKAIEIFNHLVGYTDPQTKKHVYGLYRKPTDNNERMHKYYQNAQTDEILGNPTNGIAFLYDFKECFGRLQTVVQDMEVMYSSIDNASGGLNLEDHEVFLTDGSFNTAIESDSKILRNNGVGRNRQTAFLEGEDDEQGFYRWLTDDSPGGGAAIYSGEAYWNRYLFSLYTKAKEHPNFRRNAYDLTAVETELVHLWLTDKMR